MLHGSAQGHSVPSNRERTLDRSGTGSKFILMRSCRVLVTLLLVLGLISTDKCGSGRLLCFQVATKHNSKKKKKLS